MAPTTAPKPRKIVCFSDFDGTIFIQDTGHILFNNIGCGEERRQKLDDQMKSGQRSYRDVSEEMWGSLHVPFEDGFKIMDKELEMDSGFRDFHLFCIANGIDFHVISAGLKPVLRKVLTEYLGPEEAAHIDVVANDANIVPSADGSEAEWKPVWRHRDSVAGHDKALSVQEGRAIAAENDEGEIPLIIFIGDGVSDLPAAREADVLFARRGLRLEEYCIENKIPYTAFDSFSDVRKDVEGIMKEDQQKTGGVGKPHRFNPRANMWRRVSSKQAIPSFVAATPSREDKVFLWPENFSEVRKTA